MEQELASDLDASKKFWLHTPLTEQWNGPRFDELVRKVSALLQAWGQDLASTFSPDVDPTVLATVSALRETGVFWFNNGILPPTQEAGNWPFHLKQFERWAVEAKANRIGLSADQVAGYVCSVSEAHEFCIRAARQDILREAPSAPVALIAGQSAHPGVQSAAEMLGLPLTRIRCGRLGEMDVTQLELVLDNTQDAVIVVATWRNTQGGGYDDIEAISKLLTARKERTRLPTLLHLDAARCFDDVTTLDETARVRLGLPLLLVGQKQSLDMGGDGVGEVGVEVTTLVAGGVTIGPMGRELVVALKPPELGSPGQFVECVAGSDDTVSGSRNALEGALVALHDARFGNEGLRAMYRQCRYVRDRIVSSLTAAGIPVIADARGLDLVVEAGAWLPSSLFDCWGARRLADGAAMLTVQPDSNMADAERLLGDLGLAWRAGGGRLCKGLWQDTGTGSLDITHTAAVPGATMTAQLRQIASTWRSLSAHSCGYPGNHSTLSVIGPLVARMLASPFVAAAAEWTAAQAAELLDETCASLTLGLGLGADGGRATAAFTTGSTASNRIGILTALRHLPYATVYASGAAHYSIAKIARDHERMRLSAVVNVPTDALGRMKPDMFARCLARDARAARTQNRPFAALLLASAGTTFSGAHDDLSALHAAAATVSCEIDYIHLDGALDLGASTARFIVGPPGSGPVHVASGRYIVQGVSFSLHKFPGLSVAGQVVCWTSPSVQRSGRLVAHDGLLDRRAVSELWLYRQLTSPAESEALYGYCLANANRLRSRLRDAGIATLFNSESLITLIQRLPPWLIDDFNLSPEGDWVHFICMPHITPSIIDKFVTAVIDHYSAVARALRSVHDHVSQLFPSRGSGCSLKYFNGLDTDLSAAVLTAFYHEQSAASGL